MAKEEIIQIYDIKERKNYSIPLRLCSKHSWVEWIECQIILELISHICVKINSNLASEATNQKF